MMIKSYSLSETFHLEGKSLKVSYLQGQWEGMLGSDLISIPGSPSITTHCNIACILSSNKIFSKDSDWQGLLGLAYPVLAKPDSSVTPYFDALVAEEKVKNIFSIILCEKPQHTNGKQSQGKLVLGGVQDYLHTGEILYTRIHKEWFYEVILTNMSIGSKYWASSCTELNNDKTIIDTGTSALYLPQKVFSWVKQSLQKSNVLQNQLTEEFWEATEDVCIQKGRSVSEYFHKIVMSFDETMNSRVSLVVPPELYLLKSPKTMPGIDCYKLGISSSQAGTVIGAIILKGFYIIFDRENRRIGFANSTCTDTVAAVIQTMNLHLDPSVCAYNSKEKSELTLLFITYIILAVFLSCTIPMLMMLAQWTWHYIIRK
ncbi:beta-secretase 1-like isoform X3 [Limulus polyphemus]|uniref:Beta-secretase 1-like isoform X3 n=1 Tax=Limulus polyphemus TaxID=6850 RepID=A0ABM1S8C7_LIMPO|nr:beta-secretase 1-like isoform X3 [Limulus polyphemus]XP_022239883.1 beta-secretase 1-like isoform X3 [Limulus polyphemus]